MVNIYTATVTAGANYVYTVPSYARVRVRAVTGFLTTSAVAGNRYAFVSYLDNSGNQIFVDETEAALIASKSCFYSWAYLFGWAQTAFTPMGNLCRSLPDILLNAGQQFCLNIDSVQTGDQYHYVNLTTEQWFSL
jgi:hypothetical protein